MKVLTALASRILVAFRKRNQRHLRKLNDEVLTAAAVECNKPSFNLAIFSYILSKIVSKPRFLGTEYASSIKAIEKCLERLVNRMDEGNENDFLDLFTDLEQSIASLESKDPRFVTDLVTKGKLKMAATFYAQGMSLGVASDMTNLEKHEILDYAGETMMFDRLKEEKSIEDRMKIARRLLK